MTVTANPELYAAEAAAVEHPAYWFGLAFGAADDAKHHARTLARAVRAGDAAEIQEAVKAVHAAAVQARHGATMAALYAPRDATEARACAEEAAAVARNAQEHARTTA
jgi:hypothetical protein